MLDLLVMFLEEIRDAKNIQLFTGVSLVTVLL